MYVLGINYGHYDSSVTLVKDGQIIASAAEERFTRIKHYSGLPINALSFCLEFSKVTIEDIDLIAFPSVSFPDNKLNVLFGRKKVGSPTFTNYSPAMNMSDYARGAVLFAVKKAGGLVREELPIYKKRYPCSKDGIVFLDHHLSHAASAYYTSGITGRTLVVTSDGAGDLLSLTIWLADNGKIYPRLKIGHKGSLGFFYSLVTEALGWWVGDGEGKTMGLSPYGKGNNAYGILDPYIPRYKNGKLMKGVNFGPVGVWKVPEGTIHWHFQDALKVRELIDRYGRENIAYEAQRLLEEEMVGLVSYWLNKEKVSSLAAAGGVFLNVKMNQRIWETGLLKSFHIYPDAGDGGLTAGAALYAYFNTSKSSRIFRMSNMYWGPEFSDGEIEKMLKTRKVKYKKFTPIELVKKVALLLSQNKIIGWFQGRMEAGPRALGNRSILMDPRRAENKDIINSIVKYREPFRPFCPSMTKEAGKIYLMNPMDNSAYMIVSCNVKEDKRKEIPAVVHVDGTVRPQIVTKETNPLFYQLLKEFGHLTGVEVLLNTSFNIKEEPMVCTPSDALKCFIDTGIDYLVLKSYLIGK